LTLLFVRWYNPAYDYFLMRYFRDHGIEVDEESTFERVKRLAMGLQDKVGVDYPWNGVYDPSTHKIPLPEHETLFCLYAWRWLVPEGRPSFHEIFVKTLDKRDGSEFEKIRELEAKLPSEKGKLLYTKNDVAEDIAMFYGKYLRVPLRRDFQKGAKGRTVSRYLTANELDLVLSVGRYDHEGQEKRAQEIASKLLTWLDQITPERVLNDIEKVFAEHEKSTDHMKNPEELKGGRLDLCMHRSEYLEFTVYWVPETRAVSYHLHPIRGYGLIEEVVGKGWQDMIFPWFSSEQ